MLTQLSPDLWKISAKSNGYLLVRNGRSLLVDCPCGDVAPALREAGVPLPSVVLHTQVQEEHCREWAAFPEAEVWVSDAARDVASRSPRFFADVQTVWADDRNWDDRGEEKYGIAGYVTERLPAKPLHVTRTFVPGEVLEWEGIALEVVALPVSGKRSVGFLWRERGVAFTGDFFHEGGRVVNFYDMERRYGGYCDPELEASVAMARQWGIATFLPTTGPVIENPLADMDRVLELFRNPNRAGVAHFPPERDLQNFPVIRSFGRYREVAKGLYQNTNFGNIVLFVDAQGRGMMLDPANCVWLPWADSVASMHEDLDLLEREAGLTTVEIALVTHPHGDHIQYCDLLRERYGTKILATSDVADRMERPQDFRDPCVVDWYHFPFATVSVDERLEYEKAHDWNGIAVLPMHTPGHCAAHAAFGLEWNGERVACTGDVIQYGGGAVEAGLPFCCNGNAMPELSNATTLRRILAFRPDLICCGHSRSFRDPGLTVLTAWAGLWETQLEALKTYAPGGDLTAATTSPR